MLKDCRLKFLLVLCCLMLAGCVSVVGDEHRGSLVTFSPYADINKIRKVAVIPTKNTPNFTGTAGMWETELLLFGFVVVDRGNIKAILKEQALTLSGITNPEAVPKIGKLLGVDGLLFVDRAITIPGTLFNDWGQVHLVDANNGRVVFTARLGKNDLRGNLKNKLKKAGWKGEYRGIPIMAPFRALSPGFDQKSILRVAVSPNVKHDLMAPLMAVGYDVIEREQLKAILHEQELSLQGVLSQKDMKKIGNIYGIQGMVFNEEFIVGSLRYWYVKLVHLETSQVVWAICGWGGLTDAKFYAKEFKKLFKIKN